MFRTVVATVAVAGAGFGLFELGARSPMDLPSVTNLDNPTPQTKPAVPISRLQEAKVQRTLTKNTRPRTSEKIPSPNATKQSEKWAVVQIYDLRAEYDVAMSILSTHQALFDLKMSNRVDHVVYITMDPYSSEGGDRETNATAPDGVLPAGHSTAIALFIEAGIKVISAAEVAPPVADQQKMSKRFQEADRFRKYFYKLTIFGLTQYDRMLFLDNDVVIVQDMLRLFRRSQAIDSVRNGDKFLPPHALRNNSAIYAAADPASGMCYNSGVMVFVPSIADMNGILQLLLTAPEDEWLSTCTGNSRPSGDQELIFYYFQSQKRLESVPAYYNVLISHHGHADLEGTDGWVRGQTTATKFVKWAMHDAQSRASIHAVHLAWPKPTWPMWSPNDFNPNKVVVEEERRYREENHYPTTGFWAESPGWFYEYARNGEAALSFLGLYKTFTSREVRLLTRLCKSAQSSDVEKTTNISLKNYHVNGHLGQQRDQFRMVTWCDRAKAVAQAGDEVIFPFDHAFNLDKRIGILKKKEVPTWTESLNPKFSAKANALVARADLAALEELARVNKNASEKRDDSPLKND